MNGPDQDPLERRFDVPLADISSKLVQRFHEHWLALCRDGRLPSRADVEPANFKSLLPYVILVDIEPSPFRVRYRLCGSRVIEVCGNLSGKYLDELGAGSAWDPGPYIDAYRSAVKQRRPVFIRDSMTGEFGVRYGFQAGRWPLASDGETVDMCIGIEDYQNYQPSEPNSPVTTTLP